MPRSVVTYNTVGSAFDANGTSLALQVSPLSAALNFGGFKGTNIANGTVATDVAAFGQIPTALPPSGAAGGVLDGTYPNPGLANTVAGTGLTEAADVLSVNYGTTGTTACVGNDARLSDSRAPTGSAGGVLDGTYPNPGLANSVAGTGLTEAADVLSVNYGTTSTTACAGDDARLSDSRTPSGSAGGALAGTYPNPTLASTNLYASELVVATDATVAASTGVVIPGQLTINDGINLTISDTGRVMLL